MTKQEFRELADERILILDGATGSNLIKRGMPRDACTEAWVCEHAKVLQDLQREYVESGSDIVYAPTFSANRIKLWEHGLLDRIEELNRELVRISKEAVGEKVLVAGDVTMTGAQLEPLGDLSFNGLVDIYKEQIAYLADAGVDLLVVETMLSLQETRAAVLAAHEVCDLPIMATLSFNEQGRTLYGVAAKSAIVVLQGMGVDAVGVNCSAGPDKLISVIEEMKKYAAVPIIAKPNAGMPKLMADGNTAYDMGPEEFAGCMEQILTAGAGIVGGCCGSTPEFIKRTADIVRGKKPQLSDAQDVIYLTSDREVYTFTLGQKLTVGRDIDFTQNEELVEEYQDEIFETAIELAEDMEDDVDIIAFCTDAEGIDAAKAAHEVAEEISRAVNKPLVLVSDSLETIEYALRHFTGIMALQWSHNLEEWDTKIKDMAKSYHVPIVTIDNEIIYC